MKWNHITVHPHVSRPSVMAANMCFKVHELNTQGLPQNNKKTEDGEITPSKGMGHEFQTQMECFIMLGI